jgi:hypothetical protein
VVVPGLAASHCPSDRERIGALEVALADLRREFDEFRQKFE